VRLEFIRHDSLPRLAWCARVHRGDDVAEVHHGPWVETFGDGFVEGAWSGPFNGAGPVEADHLIGTAGRAGPDRIVFYSATNLVDRIHTVEVGDDLYASNSMAFLLQITGDATDLRYLHYVRDRLRQQHAGIMQPVKTLPTARGRRIALHDHCNLSVDRALSIRRIEKPETPASSDYGEYVGRLEGMIAAIVANAADSMRKHARYRPVVTLSRGYDCNALAVLLRRHGAREAVTFARPDDDGTEVGERLGYTVTRYDRLGFRSLRGGVEAEFLAIPWGSDVVMATCQAQLEGAMLVTGRPGDLLLSTKAPAAPGLYGARINPLAGASLTEFRLRVGFLQLAPFYHGALHPGSIHRISVSPAMTPWSIGGYYDRPIARRILEEAGISRELFGQHKAAGGHFLVRQANEMSADSVSDFRDFLQTMPSASRRRWGPHPVRTVASIVRARILQRFPRVRAALGTLPTPTLDMERLFHWGSARISSRYRLL
jgi:hypothetical protein